MLPAASQNSLLNNKHDYIPEKNWTISSLLHPNGSPLSRTKPSLAVSGLFGPVCSSTQSMSALFDLNTSIYLGPIVSVFFQGHFDFILWFEFNKSLATRSAFSGVDETNTLSPILNFAVRRKTAALRLPSKTKASSGLSPRTPPHLPCPASSSLSGCWHRIRLPTQLQRS